MSRHSSRHRFEFIFLHTIRQSNQHRTRKSSCNSGSFLGGDMQQTELGANLTLTVLQQGGRGLSWRHQSISQRWRRKKKGSILLFFLSLSSRILTELNILHLIQSSNMLQGRNYYLHLKDKETKFERLIGTITLTQKPTFLQLHYNVVTKQKQHLQVSGSESSP